MPLQGDKHPADLAAAAARRLLERTPGFAPRVGLMLGSGLGAATGAVDTIATVPYANLPGFPPSNVEGHAGRFVLGTLGGVPLAVMQGRYHLYEGHPFAAMLVPVRTFKRLGCEILIVTNAAGSLHKEWPGGSLMLIRDHLNLTGTNPLVGGNDAAYGPRFPDMTRAYDSQLLDLAHEAGRKAKTNLYEGVYAGVTGPSFETPAEIRAFAALGADAVGMSTVFEAIVARHAGLRVLGISVLTNLAAGLSDTAQSSEEVLANASAASARLAALLNEVVRDATA